MPVRPSPPQGRSAAGEGAARGGGAGRSCQAHCSGDTAPAAGGSGRQGGRFHGETHRYQQDRLSSFFKSKLSLLLPKKTRHPSVGDGAPRRARRAAPAPATRNGRGEWPSAGRLLPAAPSGRPAPHRAGGAGALPPAGPAPPCRGPAGPSPPRSLARRRRERNRPAPAAGQPRAA